MSESSSKFIRTEDGNKFSLGMIKPMLEDVLASSPVKSLLEYKTISKFWYDLISAPEFKSLQLRRSIDNKKYAIFRYTDDFQRIRDVCLMGANGEVSDVITLPDFANILSPKVVCSSNGLLCLTYLTERNDLNICICNPVTQKVLTLPQGSPSAILPTVAIAFDPEYGQYKVYRFFEDTLGSKDERYACEVYASATGSWQRINDVEYRPVNNPHCSTCNHISIGGMVYWFAWRKGNTCGPFCILSTDMKKEEIKVINFPENVPVNAFSFLVDLDGRLSLVTVDYLHCCILKRFQHKKPYIDVWILDDLDNSTWSFKATAQLEVEHILTFHSVVAVKNEIFFIIQDINSNLHYHLCNLDEVTWTVFTVPPTEEWKCTLAFPFAESLSPCRGINGRQEVAC